MRQAESAALKAAGLTETGKKSGTFKRELAAVFSQVRPAFRFYGTNVPPQEALSYLTEAEVVRIVLWLGG